LPPHSGAISGSIGPAVGMPFFKNLDRIYNKMGRFRLLGRRLRGEAGKPPPSYGNPRRRHPNGPKNACSGRRLVGRGGGVEMLLSLTYSRSHVVSLSFPCQLWFSVKCLCKYLIMIDDHTLPSRRLIDDIMRIFSTIDNFLYHILHHVYFLCLEEYQCFSLSRGRDE
jgi:hypothetical protein